MKNVRLERINSEIRKAISEIIDNDLRDPQINSIISVSSVDITPDLANAKVFITSFGPNDKQDILNRIKGAGGFIRSQLSKKVKLRITPRLDFRLDNSEEYSSKIDSILKTISYSTEEESDE